ncbi:MAG: patatin-like phospholipase family protein [Flavobacteriales bacterium]|nr:patatin-like phospholipase family protein [Flavobacteriales bacterium]
MIPNPRYILTFCLLLASFSFGQDQKIGLVLSGGGATGLSHIGVIKALEENGIPIDYITGTSAGALVGSMYAIGMSPEQMEAYVLSENFQKMSNGDIKPEQRFLFREDDPHSGMISFSFSKDSILTKLLPTNFNSSAYLDFEMLKNLGSVSATVNDFDSLFVPFRCVASDIVDEESIVFRDGHLNAAVRASMTFPFYIKPIHVNGVLLFDGGLYNNFPSNVMYSDFNPDYIIGSNVSYNQPPPDQDDLIGQVTHMLVTNSDFTLPCEDGYIIKPDTDISTFDFAGVKKAIQDGYNSTIESIDTLKMQITRRVTAEELQARRQQFKQKIEPIQVTSVSTSTKTGEKELRYTRLSMIKSKKPEKLDMKELEKRYFRLYSTPQVDFIYPRFEKKKDGTHNLALNIQKAKDFKLDVGGHLSSRPVNTGYFGLTYQTIGKIITKSHVESYFGKFYGSAKADLTIEFPAVWPISSTGYFVLNRWDYFRSFATFFEDVRPSFLVQNEMYGGLEVDFPVGNTVKTTLDARFFSLEDEYYQTDKFTSKDTADLTKFDGFSTSFSFQKNSLNRKQFASGGHFLEFKARYNLGVEHSIPGTTSFQNYDVIQNHSWLNLDLKYQSFVIDKHHFHLGLNGRLVYNTRTLFANYTATTLFQTEYAPIPDAQTFFLPEYRSVQFGGVGINIIGTIRKNIDVRLDGFLYQPLLQVIKTDNGSLVYSDYFEGRSYMASASIIYQSFLGPLRATLNYFPEQISPFSFQVSFGYVLFNDRAIR